MYIPGVLESKLGGKNKNTTVEIIVTPARESYYRQWCTITWPSLPHFLPLIPTDGAPAATAARAYSICTSLPEGLKNERWKICIRQMYILHNQLK